MMNNVKNIAVPVLIAGGLVGGMFFYQIKAASGVGELAQAPMNIQAEIPPAFIMAVDDSGSMGFHTMFPNSNGRACVNGNNRRLINDSGVPHSTGTCVYYYVMPTTNSIGGGYRFLPPLDMYGAARSPDFNPSYYSPHTTYLPWIGANLVQYPDADVVNTKIDPRRPETVRLFDPNWQDTSNYFMYNNMPMQAGLRYKRRADSSWENSGSGRSWNLGNGVEANFIHEVGVFYLRDQLPAGSGYQLIATISNACGAGCSLYKYRPNTAATRQNFANWYSFYGDRTRAMIAGMTRSMLDIRGMRVGYFTINGTRPAQLAMHNMDSEAEKRSLFTSMIALRASGSTPNRRAVDYIGTQFQRRDANAPIRNQCQRNSAMLFTDGYSNEGGPAAPAISAYGVPFNAKADTIGAIAGKYYYTNLRPDLTPGKVAVPEQCSTMDPNSVEWKMMDCNKNPHMNFYGITLGAVGQIYNPDLHDVAGAATAEEAAIRRRLPYVSPTIYNSWPARNDNVPSTIDEIWQGALIGRGEYINAKSPVDILNAMRRVLAAAGGGSSPAGTAGLSGARVGDGSSTIAVTPAYAAVNNSTDWYSTLRAERASRDPNTGVISWAPLWEATDGNLIPAHGARKIFYGKNQATGVAPQVRAFDYLVTAADICSATDPLALCTPTGTTNGIVGASSKLGLSSIMPAIDYLRGDQSREEKNGGRLRDRTTRLGDIINSNPLVTTPDLDEGHGSIRLINGTNTSYPYATSYKAYIASKTAADKPAVFVGANDGMFHAFDGKTGSELFAYIPTTSLGHMGNLLFPYVTADGNNQVFRHRYYVDGPVTSSDYVAGGSWKTAVLATSGAGGRSVFALDITNPSALGASSVLWEVNDTVNEARIKNNIGYVLGRPVIVPVRSGSGIAWKAIFGNGYNSINKKAVLFVVDMATRQVTTIEAAEPGVSAANGLGNIAVVDRFVGETTTVGRDGLADTVYAADQNGAIWRFNLHSTTALTTPVFVARDSAGNRQPILGGLEVSAGVGGVMIYFGTGSFSFTGDKSDNSVQSLYGVLDRGWASTTSRSNLLAQTLTDGTGGMRNLSVNPLASNHRGWYIDLVVSGQRKGERVVGNPRVESGIVFFTTYEPGSTDDCVGDGLNRLYGVSSTSGASALDGVRVGSLTAAGLAVGQNALTLNTGGSAPVKDISVLTATVSETACNPDQTDTSAPDYCHVNPTGTSWSHDAIGAWKTAGGPSCYFRVQTSGAVPLFIPRHCGRQSWRQLQ